MLVRHPVHNVMILINDIFFSVTIPCRPPVLVVPGNAAPERVKLLWAVRAVGINRLRGFLVEHYSCLSGLLPPPSPPPRPLLYQKMSVLRGLNYSELPEQSIRRLRSLNTNHVRPLSDLLAVPAGRGAGSPAAPLSRPSTDIKQMPLCLQDWNSQ